MGCNSSSSTKAQSPAQETNPPVLVEPHIQEKALTQLKLIFESIDGNDDGSVDKTELSTALGRDANLGALIKEAGFNDKYNVLNLLDTDKDGYVSWHEFQSHLKGEAIKEVLHDGSVAAAELPASEKVLQQLRAIFDSIDANADGAVSQSELSAKLKSDTDEHGLMKDGSFGKLVDEAGLNPNFRAFDKLDTNGDNVITWIEFEAHLRKAASEEVKEEGYIAAAFGLDDSAKAAPGDEHQKNNIADALDDDPVKNPMCGCL